MAHMQCAGYPLCVWHVPTCWQIPGPFGIIHTEKPRYQNVVDRIYWPVLGTFNNYKIPTFTNKTTPIEYFDDIHKVFFDDIFGNMISLVYYGDISTTYPTTMV